MLIFGARFFGKRDLGDDLALRTRFFSLFFMPIIPLYTAITRFPADASRADRINQKLEFVKCPRLDKRSILDGYWFAWSIFAIVWGCAGTMLDALQLDEDPRRNFLVLGVSVALVGVVSVISALRVRRRPITDPPVERPPGWDEASGTHATAPLP